MDAAPRMRSPGTQGVRTALEILFWLALCLLSWRFGPGAGSPQEWLIWYGLPLAGFAQAIGIPIWRKHGRAFNANRRARRLRKLRALQKRKNREKR